MNPTLRRFLLVTIPWMAANILLGLMANSLAIVIPGITLLGLVYIALLVFFVLQKEELQSVSEPIITP